MTNFTTLFEHTPPWERDEAVSLSLLQKVKALRPKFSQAAQSVLDGWEQDESGEDAELGFGGICQDIAEQFCHVCSEHGIDCMTLSAEMGEQHVWAVAYDEEVNECCEIDINPYTYESGGGYTWRKNKGVVIEPSDVWISSMLWRDFSPNLTY